MNKDPDYTKMNPGIRNAVRWLRDKGFDTFNSGDGATHDCCDRDRPFVAIFCTPRELSVKADLLYAQLRLELGCDIFFDNDLYLQAIYDPEDGFAVLDVDGVALLRLGADEDVPARKSELPS